MYVNQLIPKTVWCIYPVSGTYTRFQQYLYLIIISFIICCRFHQWLTTGMVAFAACYSSVVCLHIIILATQADSVYDADFIALSVVLEMCTLTAIICMLFSPRILNNAALKLFIGWALLMYAARMFLFTVGAYFVTDIKDVLLPVNCNSDTKCTNPCDAMSQLTKFRGRSADSLQPVLWEVSFMPVPENMHVIAPWVDNAAVISDPGYSWIRSYFWWYLYMGLCFSIVLVNIWKAPRDARNVIFIRLQQTYVPRARRNSQKMQLLISLLAGVRHFYRFVRIFVPELRLIEVLLSGLLWCFKLCIWHCRRFQWKQSPARRPPESIKWPKFLSFDDIAILESRKSRAWYVFAKAVAVLWYSIAYLSCYGSIALGAFFIAKSQQNISWIPESESKESVGQWSTWVTLSLGILASIFQSRKSNMLLHHHIIRLTNAPKERDLDAHLITHEEKVRAEEAGNIWRYVTKSCIHEWQDFKHWWKDPIVASKTGEKDHSDALQDETFVWGRFCFEDQGLPSYRATLNMSRSRLKSTPE